MKKAVILFNLGGPDKIENVEPFLFNLFNDPAILNLPTLLRYPLAKLISNRSQSPLQLDPDLHTFRKANFGTTVWGIIGRDLSFCSQTSDSWLGHSLQGALAFLRQHAMKPLHMSIYDIYIYIYVLYFCFFIYCFNVC